MTERKHPETRPISLRVTKAEEEQLLAKAGSQPLSAHIREKLFGTGVRKRAIHVPRPLETQLAKSLAELGRSEIAANLHELAKAARLGALPVTPETEHAIRCACDTVERMRIDLLNALGLRRGNYE